MSLSKNSPWLHFYESQDEMVAVKKIKLHHDTIDEWRSLTREELSFKIYGYGTVTRPAMIVHESDEVVGDRRMFQIRTQLDNMVKNGRTVVRSYSQTLWHDAMTRSMIHLIYGSNVYNNNKYQILAKHGMKKHHYLIIIVASRQVGKSTCVAMFAAVVICYVPNIDMAIFANNKHRSQELMEQIYNFVRCIPGMISKVTSKNAVEMRMVFETAGMELDQRRVHCYTASNEVKIVIMFI